MRCKANLKGKTFNNKQELTTAAAEAWRSITREEPTSGDVCQFKHARPKNNCSNTSVPDNTHWKLCCHHDAVMKRRSTDCTVTTGLTSKALITIIRKRLSWWINVGFVSMFFTWCVVLLEQQPIVSHLLASLACSSHPAHQWAHPRWPRRGPRGEWLSHSASRPFTNLGSLRPDPSGAQLQYTGNKLIPVYENRQLFHYI